MSYRCSRCGRIVQKLVPIDDACTSAQYTQLLDVAYPCTDYVCITCAKEMLGISDADLIQEERERKLDTEFLLNLTKGRLAQVVIETIFQEFGYEVYPYGYESYLTNIIKFLRKSNANIPARKVRATPDLFVYDREFNEGFFIEIKATNTPDETRFWISKSTLQTYLTYWRETVLVIYCITSLNIYCKPLEEINPEDLPIERSSLAGKELYCLNLKADFYTLPDYFRLIVAHRYKDFCQKVRVVLKQFGSLES